MKLICEIETVSNTVVYFQEKNKNVDEKQK